MKWKNLIPWLDAEKNEDNDSKDEDRVIEGTGPDRIIVNESE